MSINITPAFSPKLSTLAFVRKGTGLRLRVVAAWALCYLLILNPLCAVSSMTATAPPRKEAAKPDRDAYLDGLLPEVSLPPQQYQPELLLSELAVSQEEVTLDKRQVDRMVFAIFAAKNLRQRRLSELLGPSLALLVEAYKLSPALNPAEIAPLFQLIRNNLPLASVLPPKSLLRTGIVTATEIATTINRKSPAVTPALVEKINMEITALRGGDFVNPSPINDVLKPLQYSIIDVTMDEFLQDKLEAAFDLAITNGAFYQAFLQAFGDYLGVGMFEGAAVTLRNSPAAPEFLKNWVQPNGTLTVAMATADAAYQAQFDAAQSATDENLSLLQTVNTGQFAPSPQAVEALNRYVADPTNEELAKLAGDAEEEKYKKREQLINQISNGIKAAAKVISYFRGGTEAAEKVKRIGESVVKFANDVNNFVKYARIIATNPIVKSLKLATLLPLGSPLLAIGVIGVAFIAFKLFKAFGRSDSAVRKKLDQINAKIDRLRQEMHARFDRIDKRLDEIFARVDEGFRNLNEKVDEIRGRLVELSANLARLESNIYGWIGDLSRRELQEQINLCIGYRERNGQMPTDVFDKCANTFYTWAVNNSKDSIALGPLNRDYGDNRIYDELTTYPLEANINYLAQFPARNLGLPPLANSVLSNPRYLLVSTNADALLRAENPDLNQRNPVLARRKAMFDLGKQVQAMVEAVTILNTSSGPKANHPLFDRLLSKYDEKAGKLRDAIKKVEDDYKNAAANRVVRDVDVWRDAYQPEPPPSVPSAIQNCITYPGLSFSLMSPNNLAKLDQAMPKPFSTASRMGLGDLSYCLDLNWGQSSGVTNNLIINLIKRYRATGQSESSGWFVSLTLGGFGPSVAGDFNAVVSRWNSEWKSRFEQEATVVNRYTTQQLEDTANRVNALLQTHRVALASKILAELNAGSLQNPLRELAGARKLLESYLELGMSRSLEENDTLRGLLYGDQQLPDDAYLKAVYASIIDPANRVIAAPNGDIRALTTTRVSALGEVIHGLLDDIYRFRQANPPDARLASNTEGLLALDTTLQELELAIPDTTIGKITLAHSQGVVTKVSQSAEFAVTGFDSELGFDPNAPAFRFIFERSKRGRTIQPLTGANNKFLYTPETDFIGQDSARFTMLVSQGGIIRESASATVSFNVTGTLCGVQSFQSSVILANATEPFSAVARDFNRDGNLDLAVCDAKANNVRILSGNGAGSFTASATLAVGQNPLVLTADDFNRDGRLDLATGNYQANTISILLQNNLGGFNPAVNIPVGTGPRGIASADFNNDGRRDLVVANRDSRNVSILIGNGDGTFKTATNITVGPIPVEVEVADFNNDGKQDFVVAVSESNSVALLLGKGDGQFEAPVNFLADSQPISLALGDFNGDNEIDLAVGNNNSTKMSILMGDGSGRFPVTKHFDTGIPGFTIASGDFNQDGRDDVVVGGYASNRITVFSGDGVGSFSAPTAYNTGRVITDVVVGDFNSDKRPDLVVVNSLTPNVTLLSSRCAAAPTVATVSAASYQPSVARDSIVSIFGSAMASSTQSANTVPLPTTLAGTTVTIRDSLNTEQSSPLFFASPSQINCHIPPGMAPGTASVTVVNSNGAEIVGSVQISDVAPGLFTANASGQGVPAAVVLRIKANGAQIYEEVARFDAAQNRFVAVPLDVSNPQEQVYLLLFGTGFRNRRDPATVSVRIGGLEGAVNFAGAQGGFVGLDQLNVLVPRALSGRGEVEIALTVDGKSANNVSIAVR